MPATRIGGQVDGGWLARGMALASTAALMATRINPILVIAAGVVIFVSLRALLPV